VWRICRWNETLFLTVLKPSVRNYMLVGLVEVRSCYAQSLYTPWWHRLLTNARTIVSVTTRSLQECLLDTDSYWRQKRSPRDAIQGSKRALHRQIATRVQHYLQSQLPNQPTLHPSGGGSGCMVPLRGFISRTATEIKVHTQHKITPNHTVHLLGESKSMLDSTPK
jgi:hypothetical protein